MGGETSGAPSRGERDEGRAARARFDLRFEAGRGLLVLARPLETDLGKVAELELVLGRVEFPVDVTEGPRRFRTRRTVVRRAVVRIEARALARMTERAGVALELGDASEDGVLRVALRDAFGVIGVDLAVASDGRDLLFALRGVRTVADGPSTPYRRVFEAARALGLELEEETGLFRLARPARALLARALVAEGYRIPDDRGADLAPPRRDGNALVLELDVSPDGPGVGASLDLVDTARSFSRALSCLARDDVDEARAVAHDELCRLEARAHEAPEVVLAVRRLALSLDAERLGGEAAALAALAGRDDAEAVALTLRLATRIGDVALTARAAERMLSVEPLSSLVADAWLRVSDAIATSDAHAAHALISRAVSRRPKDVPLALRRIELARRIGDATAVEAAATKALLAPLDAKERALLVSAAARALERLDRRADAERLYREALFASPDDPDALEGLAGLHASRGDRAAAVVRLDRAARVRLESGDRAAAAAALRRAAELLVSAGKLGGAEARLARALGHDPEQPSHACALARVRVRNGDLGGAAAAYDHLLGLEGLTGPGPALSHALVEAATFHLDDLEDRAGARPFLEMLVRRAPSDPRVAPLTHRVNGLTQHPPPLARREDEDGSEAGDEALEPEVVVDAHARTELFKKSRPPDASEPESESEAESEDEDESASEPDSVFVTDSTEGASPLRASPTAAREALASLGPARSASEPDTRAAELVARGALPTDAGALARLEARAEDDRVRAKISRALADALRREGRHADAALALARAGRATRDAATLRAALDLAERAGAWRSALEVIGLALEVVGAGPARAALERARSRIEALLGE